MQSHRVSPRDKPTFLPTAANSTPVASSHPRSMVLSTGLWRSTLWGTAGCDRAQSSRGGWGCGWGVGLGKVTRAEELSGEKETHLQTGCPERKGLHSVAQGPFVSVHEPPSPCKRRASLVRSLPPGHSDAQRGTPGLCPKDGQQKRTCGQQKGAGGEQGCSEKQSFLGHRDRVFLCS